MTLLLGILPSLTLAGSSTVESRKRKRKEINCYPLAELKFTILWHWLFLWAGPVYVIRNQNNLHPEGSWRYVKWGGKAEGPERQQREHWPFQECCAVLTSCQRISTQVVQPVPGSEGPGHTHRALLAVKTELCAWHDRVTIVENAAKVQWVHSAACLTLTPSLLPTLIGQNRNTQCAICCISPTYKSTYSTTSINTEVFTCEIPGTKLEWKYHSFLVCFGHSCCWWPRLCICNQ